MTADRYFTMMEQLGREPIESEIPPDWSDLPNIVQVAINMYSKLGDRIVAEMGFIGKDYTLLETLLNLEELETVEEKELIVEIIHWLEQRQIKRSADHLKKEQEKIKRKTPNGKKFSHP